MTGIGDRIRAMRTRLGLSQADVATRMGAAREYLSRLENGHTSPTIETVERIAEAMGVAVGVFFDEASLPTEGVRILDEATVDELLEQLQVKANMAPGVRLSRNEKELMLTMMRAAIARRDAQRRGDPDGGEGTE